MTLQKDLYLKKNSAKNGSQQLLSGNKRLNGFKGEVKPKIVGQFISEISERNKEVKVTNVLSVTNSRGFIDQSQQFDRTVASEDASNYKIVRKGQFAYNPSRVNVGSLDLLRNFDEGILSPMYVVFSSGMTTNSSFCTIKLNGSIDIPMFEQKCRMTLLMAFVQ